MAYLKCIFNLYYLISHGKCGIISLYLISEHGEDDDILPHYVHVKSSFPESIHHATILICTMGNRYS